MQAFEVVNAAGFVTGLGGATLHPAAIEALADASARHYDVTALAAATGDELARLIGVPGAAVTAGAAAGLTLAVGAAIVGDDPTLADAMPMQSERVRVVTQTTLSNAYERVVRLTGARIDHVGVPSRPGLGQTLPWQLDGALSEPAAAVLHTVASDDAAVSLEEVIRIAHRRGVPVVVDAAAELPPASALRTFVEQGADLVVFSGGKALRGPQASGLVLGRPDLVATVRRLQEDTDVDPVLWHETTGSDPWQQGIGRPMKVPPSTILALAAAVKAFLMHDHDADADAAADWLSGLRDALGVGRLVAPRGRDGFFPSLAFDLGPARARQAWRALADGLPSVRAAQAELGGGVLRIRPEAVAGSERDTVADALLRIRHSGLLDSMA
ncbi:MAG TPA: aminotransferase class V-fold PLP-dependent enzyme [Actinomycetes bacterium]|nr:aminotransferase class V-fold PLP-dependent enzyme [Actinomycetes bacterium]